MEKEITKQEKRDIEKHGYTFAEKDPSGLTIKHLIVISHGNRELHDSGYPFIKIFGETEGGGLVSLGWHDHFISYVPTNTDSLGKNIFRVMPWMEKSKKWKVSNSFFSCSTFQIGEWKDDSEFIILS